MSIHRAARAASCHAHAPLRAHIALALTAVLLAACVAVPAASASVTAANDDVQVSSVAATSAAGHVFLFHLSSPSTAATILAADLVVGGHSASVPPSAVRAGLRDKVLRLRLVGGRAIRVRDLSGPRSGRADARTARTAQLRITYSPLGAPSALTATAGAVPAPSNTVTATPLALAPAPARQHAAAVVPTTPSGVVAAAGDRRVGLKWKASTSLVGIAGYRVYRGGAQIAAPTSLSYDDSGLRDGTTYTYTVAAVDTTGAISATSAPVSATPKTPADTQAPVATWRIPADEATVKGQLDETSGTCDVTASDDVGVDHVVFSLDGTALNTEVAAPWACHWNTALVPDGSRHTLKAVAYDAAGNASAPAQITVTVQNGAATPPSVTTPPPVTTPPADTTAPDTQITAQPAASTTSTSATFGFTGSDNVAVSGYECKLDSGSYGACASPQSYSALAVGSHTFSVRARDAAANVDATPATFDWTITAAVGDATCDRYASTTGSDSAAGTLTAPYASPQKLLDSLAAGQTGCLRAGTYTQQELRVNHSGSPGAPITLTSYPGERATVQTNTDIYLPDPIAYVSFVNLNVRDNPSSGSLANVMIQDFSENSVWQGDDISGSGLKTCYELGSVGWGRAHNTLIRGNRIHDCGNPADGNQDHAIYFSQVDDATVIDNVFYANAAFTIHFYPDANNVQVTHNVIDGSGYGGVIFASDQTATGLRSDNNTVAYNIVSGGARYGMLTYWGPAGVGTGNSAHDNCMYANAGGDTDNLPNVAQSGNVHANPLYANAAAHDYRLGAGSGCLAVVGYDTAARLGF